MKKNNFMEGSFISTAGIIICKIIGLLYVIPFYAMISNTGSALYSYAYSIYAVFLSLSTSGIPIAMSKLISEYNTLGYNYTKEKIYKLGHMIILGLGVFFFILLFILAPTIASYILGKTTGGNTVADVTLVIRIVASALLIVPSLSVIKGYYQGHKFMSPPSISNVLEQLVRVLVILLGCFISLKVFNVKESIAIGISVFAATIGALFAFLYLYYKRKKNLDAFHASAIKTKEEAKFTTKYLLKQIIFLSIPFIVVDVLKSSYNLVDTLTVVRTLTNIGYAPDIAETAFSVIGTWGSKLNMIIISFALGISTSLIPNIASDYIKKNDKAVNARINQAICTLFFITIPMTIGLFLLARPVWIIFYGYNDICISVFKGFVLQAITFSLITVLINILQTTNKNKMAVIILFISFISNAMLNIPMMYLCEKIGIGGYQGASVATLITQFIPCLYIFYYMKKKLKLSYKKLFINTIKIVLATSIMAISILILNMFIPFTAISRLNAIKEVIIFALFGIIIYAYLMHKCGLLKELFGDNLLKKFYKTHD